MSVTAVPIRPIRKGSVARLWIGLAALSLGAGALAWAGTAGQHYTTTESGLQFRVIEEGEGPHPAPTDIVLIDYTGRLEDGTVFDTSVGKQPVPLPVTGSIPGFAESLQMMRKGGTYRLKIPSELAYGPEGAGGVIPPDADLEFEVALIDFVPASALQGMGMPPPGM
ncbi:FKBP-type peptidyl-prolyl cis-trans isomerase [Allosphingosinicella sp.]|uniref:FKBP-type peptidyl-prolyl cis-trans isomerase n=1 Tax=Allosphingosinicella sp. TaxID=2823234 RepID=UPI002FC10A9F